MNRRPMQRRVNVLGVEVDPLYMESALMRVRNILHRRLKGYISVVGVHGIMEAQRNPELANIFSGSLLTVPDGMPTVWVGKFQGHRLMERVTGPDLMLEIFRRPDFAGYTHFFCGGNDGVADELAAILKAQFPWASIAGTYTPPFRELTPQEEDALAARIQACGAHIVWVGISTPKQEVLMSRLLPKLDTALMFGVGAAFDYHTGRIRDCAPWIKRAGMQWLHRLLQDPARLWRRYLRNNPEFVCKIILQLCGLRDFSSPGERDRTLGKILPMPARSPMSPPIPVLLQSDDNSLTAK